MKKEKFYYKTKTYNGFTQKYDDDYIEIIGERINATDDVFVAKQDGVYRVFDVKTCLVICSSPTKKAAIKTFYSILDKYYNILKQDWYLKAVNETKSRIGGVLWKRKDC